MALLAAICLCVFAYAQTPASRAKSYHVNYTDETWLAQNGQDVWLVRLDLEWPQVLDDCVMPQLQTYLSEKVLGVQASSYRDAFAALERKAGARISRMPDDNTLTRHYLNASLQITWYEPGRYVSFRLQSSETDSNGRATRSDRQWFTYDIVNDRVLTADDVFHTSNMAGTYDETNRMVFENLIAENARCSESEMASIDLRTLPKDFAVEGALMRFGLGGTSDNYSYMTMEHMEQLSLLNRKFQKWYKGEAKAKTAPATLETHPIAQQVYYTGSETDSVSLVADVMPQYAEGRDSLFSFIAHHFEFPDECNMDCKQGRVIVSFVVEKDGSLSNFAVIRSMGFAFDRAAVAAVRQARPWKPGMKDGQPVRMCNFLPVSFRVE